LQVIASDHAIRSQIQKAEDRGTVACWRKLLPNPETSP
jgi:hypothetical protein